VLRMMSDTVCTMMVVVLTRALGQKNRNSPFTIENSSEKAAEES